MYCPHLWLLDRAGQSHMHLECFVDHVESLQPEGAVGSNASAWTHHDDGSGRILGHVEGMCLANITWHLGTNLDTIQPCGTHTIVLGTLTLWGNKKGM